MKVLVTGGAGFIGSHLVDALIAAGHGAVIVDHWKKEKLRFPNEAATIYKVPLDGAELEAVFAKEHPDAVCHLAAQISVTRSVADPIADAATNIVNSVRLLELSRRHNAKFVFASSGGAIYGDHPERPTPEKYDAKPVSPYGVGKQALEHYLDLYREQFGHPSVSLRFSNVYGPRQLPGGEASVIAIFLEKLRRGEPAIIFGDGSMTRDFLFVKDAVDAFVRAIEGDFVGTINVSTGEETTVTQLWDLLRRIHGRDHVHEFHPFRAGEVRRSVLSPAAAKQALSWEPRTKLEEGLAETYAWFMDTFGRDV